ncbi:hypothetical protein SAMN05444166_0288 [Singulisphaera sp. GP187]|uniref:hypothetical protein n=1 Tax=Singulisphaera sp. GP187 TaxID=1882752 RepID=UPI0009289977|nr:hypothetical protein [Singulisphaera sp. GP187]SIN70718.1 hypothetical protein SAMN05444166_0288 [Singulisphaera sp. GP187]
MLTTYATKLIARPSPHAAPSVCPFCREAGRLEVVHVYGKAHQRVVGCRCERRHANPEGQSHANRHRQHQ